jgi:acyl-CoA synthetase (NDP forming)
VDVIARLLCPRSVAVIGASADPAKLTGRPILYLRKHGFAGAIYPVNPRAAAIGDLKCYPDAKSLPAAPDAALILLGAERVEDAVRDLAAAGCAVAVVLASGFGETGEDGRQRQAALKAAAGSMRLLGPNTIGIVNVTDRIMLSASGAMEIKDFTAGPIALVSQSGGILGSLLSRGVAHGLGFSKLIATGNEADLEVTDIIEHLADDGATQVIALYLEGLRHPDRFRAAVAKARGNGKSVVAFKVGRTESGARSAISHTGALAGADRVYDALFHQLGVIRAERFADLIDIPAALAQRRRLDGRRLAIVTTTGGAATLIADATGLAGFDTPPPDAETAQRLRAIEVRDAVLDRNPVDVTLAGLQGDVMRNVIDALLASPSYDAVVTVIGSSAIGQPDLVAKPLIAAMGNTTKPLLAYVSPDAPQIVQHLNRHGVPAFAAPESIATALSAMLRATQAPKPMAEPAVAAAMPRDLDLPAGPLNEFEAKQMFARFGIPSVREVAVQMPADAQAAARSIGGPVVVKVLSRQIAHKTEIGGVALGVAADDVALRCEAMRKAASAALEGFLVQEMITGGVEMILGCQRDPQFGPAILLGFGGVQAELLTDTALRLPPLTRDDARAMIDALKLAPLLNGYRGRPAADVAALADAIVAFAQMAQQLGERLVEAEINPLFVLPQGQGVRAADGLVVLRDAEPA